MSMRHGWVIIGKVGGPRTKGRRDRGLKGLRRIWRSSLGGVGLDENSGRGKRGPSRMSPGFPSFQAMALMKLPGTRSNRSTSTARKL